jgi:hypothetical protein
MQLPHWLVLAGAFLVAGGFLGLAFGRKQQAVSVPSPDDDQPSESAEPSPPAAAP